MDELNESNIDDWKEEKNWHWNRLATEFISKDGFMYHKCGEKVCIQDLDVMNVELMRGHVLNCEGK